MISQLGALLDLATRASLSSPSCPHGSLGGDGEGTREQGLGPASWSLQFPRFPCRRQEKKSQPRVALAPTTPQLALQVSLGVTAVDRCTDQGAFTWVLDAVPQAREQCQLPEGLCGGPAEVWAQ